MFISARAPSHQSLFVEVCLIWSVLSCLRVRSWISRLLVSVDVCSLKLPHVSTKPGNPQIPAAVPLFVSAHRLHWNKYVQQHMIHMSPDYRRIRTDVPLKCRNILLSLDQTILESIIKKRKNNNYFPLTFVIVILFRTFSFLESWRIWKLLERHIYELENKRRNSNIRHVKTWMWWNILPLGCRWMDKNLY